MALNNRTKLGFALAIAVLAARASIWLAVLALVLAALLIALGQAPERTETFFGGLPGGNYLLKAGGVRHAMMDNDIRIAPKGINETLCDRVAELEELEAIGAATPDTREKLADLHEFLDKLHAISLEHVRKALH